MAGPFTPYVPCANCGTTAYTKPDMVGNLCPACWAESTALDDLTKQLATAKLALARNREAADERQKRVDEGRKASEDLARKTKSLGLETLADDLGLKASKDGEVHPVKPAKSKATAAV